MLIPFKTIAQGFKHVLSALCFWMIRVEPEGQKLCYFSVQNTSILPKYRLNFASFFCLILSLKNKYKKKLTNLANFPAKKLQEFSGLSRNYRQIIAAIMQDSY